MDARSTRKAVLAVLAVALLATGVARAPRPDGSIAAAGPPDTLRIGETERAAGARFAPEVASADRAWIESAVMSARPEAQALIAKVDGLVEWRTIPAGDPLGVTRPRYHGDAASFTIDLNIGQLDGRRVQDRSTTVLHELGHVVDLALVPQALDEKLDAEIPRTGTCGIAGPERTGSCTEPVERFADTFAKWALRGSVSQVGAGYGVGSPASLEDWGAPLVPLANP